MTAARMNPCPLPVHRFRAEGAPQGTQARCDACGSVIGAEAGRWYLRGAADMARSAVRDAEAANTNGNANKTDGSDAGADRLPDAPLDQPAAGRHAQ